MKKYTFNDIKEGCYIKLKFYSQGIGKGEYNIREGIVSQDERFPGRFVYGGEQNDHYFIEDDNKHDFLIVASPYTHPEYFI